MFFDLVRTIYQPPQLDSTVNTNSRRHVEDVRTVITMITTDFGGGLGRSNSIAMVHLFCSTASGFCEPVANFGEKMKLPGMHIKQKRTRNVYEKINAKRVLPSFAKK